MNIPKKPLSFFLAAFILFSLPAFSATQNFSAKKSTAPKLPIEAPASALTVGEKIIFDVSWMGIHVGTGTLEVRKEDYEGRSAYHLIAVAKTNDFLSKLYPVEDEIHSFVDAENFCSLEFRKTLREGRYRADESIRFDTARGVGYYESFHNKSKKEVPIEGDCVQDILSLFFWFRLQNVEVGRSLNARVNSEEKNWDVELKPLRRETKELRGGEIYDTIVIEPKTRLKGVLRERGHALVYFTTDSRRLPIWISLKTPFGPVNGVLRTEDTI